MTDNTNPNAYYAHKEYLQQPLRYSNRHEEIRFQIFVLGNRTGHIVGFDPSNPRVTV